MNKTTKEERQNILDVIGKLDEDKLIAIQLVIESRCKYLIAVRQAQEEEE